MRSFLSPPHLSHLMNCLDIMHEEEKLQDSATSKISSSPSSSSDFHPNPVLHLLALLPSPESSTSTSISTTETASNPPSTQHLQPSRSPSISIPPSSSPPPAPSTPQALPTPRLPSTPSISRFTPASQHPPCSDYSAAVSIPSFERTNLRRWSCSAVRMGSQVILARNGTLELGQLGR